MDRSTVLLNAAYVFMVLSPLFRKMLWLRVTVVVSSIFFVAYGLAADARSVVVWNALFGLFHLYHVVRLVMARRAVRLRPEEQLIRDRLFPQMELEDFIYFWEMGRPQHFADEFLCRAGRTQKKLILILDGYADVTSADGEFLAEAAPNELVGEMSFLSGNPATADVRSRGELLARVWVQDDLRGLERLRPSAALSLTRSLGSALSVKVGTTTPG